MWSMGYITSEGPGYSMATPFRDMVQFPCLHKKSLRQKNYNHWLKMIVYDSSIILLVSGVS